MANQTSAGGEPHPTALVAVDDREARNFLVDSLQQDNCLVLEAESVSRVLDVVRVHSRPIHVVLLDVEIGDHALAALLRRYRSELQVVFVPKSPNEGQRRAMELEGVLTTARQILKRSKWMPDA